MMLAHKHQFDAIGTSWSIDTAQPLSQTEIQHISEKIETFDATYSRFRADSLTRNMYDHAPGSFTFPESIVTLFNIYEKLHRLTHNKINPLVGTSLEQLGYDAHYSFVPHAPHPAPDFDATILTGTTLTPTEPILLDIGAVGKGYLVDEIAKIIGQRHPEFVVDGSGDIAVRTETPEIVGLEHPADASRVIGAIAITHGSLCASALNRRTWGSGFHHVVDATSGESIAGDSIATWAIADTTLVADALTTALFFAPVADLRREFGDFWYVIMKKNGDVMHNIPPDKGEMFA